MQPGRRTGMERRTFLGLLAIPALAELLVACGGSENGIANPSGVATLKGTAKRTAGGDPSAAATAVNAFAGDLFARLAPTDATKNLVFSPLSIAVALAMVSAGSKGATLAEIDGALHVTDPTGIHHSMNALTAAFDATNKSQSLAAQGGTGEQTVKVHITNSLWAQQGLALAPTYLDTLSAEYGTGVQTVDYASDTESARIAINRWVDDATEGRIPELLDNGVLTPDTLLTLVNAVYLNASWAEPFEIARTKGETFTTADDRSVGVQMMHRGGALPYAEGGDWQAVELPYAFGDLGMVMAMGRTPTTPLPDIDQLAPQLQSRTVVLGMPKFDFGTATGLSDTLKAMGIATAFTDTADFSGITTGAALFITDVVHQANITVDEQGTEAAAATAAAMAGTSAPTDVVELTLNRPFTFWLRERSTGAVLFMGRVNDPAA